jgi:predicted enzyme related to lactoylglutathione lyase
MKKAFLLTLALVATFGLGFAFNEILTKQTGNEPVTKRVRAIGGIFFKCKDPKKLKDWYKIHLGLNTNEFGTTFEWRQAGDSSKKGYTVWSPFSEKTKYFEPSAKDFMINYRVDNLESLVAELKKENVTIADTIETVSYGKFVHILDLEGNKIELWEPVDSEYEKIGGKNGGGLTK